MRVLKCMIVTAALGWHCFGHSDVTVHIDAVIGPDDDYLTVLKGGGGTARLGNSTYPYAKVVMYPRFPTANGGERMCLQDPLSVGMGKFSVEGVSGLDSWAGPRSEGNAVGIGGNMVRDALLTLTVTAGGSILDCGNAGRFVGVMSVPVGRLDIISRAQGDVYWSDTVIAYLNVSLATCTLPLTLELDFGDVRGDAVGSVLGEVSTSYQPRCSSMTETLPNISFDSLSKSGDYVGADGRSDVGVRLEFGGKPVALGQPVGRLSGAGGRLVGQLVQLEPDVRAGPLNAAADVVLTYD